ncbi:MULTISPECIES: DNA cytosine methyltransferase [unclassified Microcoleus]|uniref:DNA cytosine methyltransferase n=1 Tax=unclassified Microcoleus TaxID=2642155 RepID=UPI0040408F9A
MLRTLELFSGIGGLRLGFESVGGFQFNQAVEISPTARAVYNRHFANTPIWDDVRIFRATPGQFDCIIGGSPCQDLSGCGKKQGLGGDRSSLWWEMLRIIDECRPAFIGWENVEGALHRGAREVIASLRMVGYKAEGPVLISAAELGAPHLRKRIFLVAYRNDLSLGKRGNFTGWEEQIGEHLAIAYSYSSSKRWQPGVQLRENWWHKSDGIPASNTSKRQQSDVAGEFEGRSVGDSERSRLQGNLAQQEAGSQCDITRQPTSISQVDSISEPPSMGLDDGIPEILVRVGTDAPDWLAGVRRSGWWDREPAPVKVGLNGKRIQGRRDSINHYGAACVPAQAIPLALRIRYLSDLANKNSASYD